MPAEAIRTVLTPEIEGRALEMLPAEGAANRHAQVLTGDFVRNQAIDLPARHAARLIARQDAQVAQPIPAKTSRPKRAQQIPVAQLRGPDGRAPAGIVVCRRQVGRVVSTGPDVRRDFGPAT